MPEMLEADGSLVGRADLAPSSERGRALRLTTVGIAIPYSSSSPARISAMWTGCFTQSNQAPACGICNTSDPLMALAGSLSGSRKELLSPLKVNRPP